MCATGREGAPPDHEVYSNDYHAGCSRGQQQALELAERRRETQVHTDDHEDVLVSIRWGKYTSKCMDVTHLKDRGYPGMHLQIWDCPEDRRKRDMFTIPLPGKFGPIRPQSYPHLCLETEDGYHLQFKTCTEVAEQQMLFTVREGDMTGYHHVHLAADPSKCIDIPNDNFTNGNYVMLWKCNEHHTERPGMQYRGTGYVDATDSLPVPAADRIGDEILLIEQAPQDCMWSDWSSWSSCSEHCGPGHRTRYRSVEQGPAEGGELCKNDWHQVHGCFEKACDDSSQTIAHAVGPDTGFNWVPLLIAFALGCLLIPFCLVCLRRVRKAQAEAALIKHEEERASLLEEARRRADEESRALSTRRRDAQGWERVERLRLARQDADEKTRVPFHKDQLIRLGRMKESGSQTEALTCPSQHELLPPMRPERKWVCDGVNLFPRGCRSGITKMDHHPGKRYRCEPCDYDLCELCYEAVQAMALELEGEHKHTFASGDLSSKGPLTSSIPNRWGAGLHATHIEDASHGGRFQQSRPAPTTSTSTSAAGNEQKMVSIPPPPPPGR